MNSTISRIVLSMIVVLSVAQAQLPPQIIARGDSSWLVRSNGTFAAWGSNADQRLGVGLGAATVPTPFDNTTITSITDFAAGGAHGLLVRTDATVWSWGSNSSGQLGIAGPSVLASPQQVYLPPAMRVAAGNSHSVVLLTNGLVITFGLNNYGQLGYGYTGSGGTGAGMVANVSSVTDLASGGDHTLALKSNGTVMSWGRNDMGQLGRSGSAESATLIPNLTGVVAVACGDRFSLVLKSNGTVMSFGENADGQLGLGTTSTTSTPTLVSGLASVTAIACGTAHALARRSDGTVMVWGRNSSGQLGIGTTNNPLAPAPLAGFGSCLSVAAGGAHSLLLRADGGLYVAGTNAQGQLGTSAGCGIGPVLIPTTICGLSNVIQIATGADHTLFLRADGTVWVTGGNGSGQLGMGDFVARNTPVLVPNLSAIVEVAAGTSFSLARRADGLVYSWGANSLGQLGKGFVSGSVSQANTSPLALGAVEIAAGASFAAARAPSGAVLTWGSNSNYALGRVLPASLTTYDPSPSPVPISAPCSRIVADGETAIAVAGNALWVWGKNNAAKLGVGSMSCQGYNQGFSYACFEQVGAIALPQPIMFAGDINGLALDMETLFVRASNAEWLVEGRVDGMPAGTPTALVCNVGYCAGVSVAYLAQGDFPSAPSLLGVQSVAAGASWGMAIGSTGEVLVWGQNGSGQLGVGSTTANTAATVNTWLAGAQQLYAGSVHGFAIMPSGIVKAWGGGGAALGLGSLSAPGSSNSVVVHNPLIVAPAPMAVTVPALVPTGPVPFAITTTPSKPNQLYWLDVSVTGTTPGVSLPGGSVLPLNAPFLFLEYGNILPTFFDSFVGQLDLLGSATATLHVPHVWPMVGLDVAVAALTFESGAPGGVGAITNPLSVRTVTPIAQVSAVWPNNGPFIGGTSVSVQGAGFMPGATVAFDGVPATNVVVHHGQLMSCTTPMHGAGAVTVSVTNTGVAAGSLSGAFTYLTQFPAPTLGGVSPSEGPIAGGVPMVLTGTGFRAGATVAFDGAAANNVQVVSSTEISCVSPAGLLGAASVVVMNDDAQAATATASFNYIPNLSITSVVPPSSAPGATITVTGTGFQSGLVLTAAGVPVVPQSIAPTSITFAMPMGTTCSSTLTIDNPSTQSASVPFNPMPQVNQVFFGSGPAAGNAVLVIVGQDFHPGLSVTIGGAPALIEVQTTTQLQLRTPPGSPGTAAIVISSGTGCATTASYVYL